MEELAEASWGNTTAKPSGGGSADPNVLSLKEANRMRLLEPGARKWRQHYITSATDPDQGRSVVCPKGADGRDQSPCPLCMKPVGLDGKQRFSISRRFATNVWDHESGGVKVLIAGPQVFEEFDAAAALGMDPTETDWLVHKMGQGMQTSYKVIRGNAAPLPTQITPEMLHDLSKYDTPTSAERIFELLDDMGIDYDALEMPSFTVDEAEAFVMPFGKHKSLTIEQMVATDLDYAKFMHGKMLDGGSIGDPVFVAMHTVLADRNEVEAIDDMPASAPRPAAASSQSAPTAQPTTQPIPDSGVVTLIGPDGAEVQVPESIAGAMRAAGFVDPPEPEPVTPAYVVEADGMVTLAGSTGEETRVPEALAATLMAAGFIAVSFGADPDPAEQETQARETEPDDGDEVAIDIGGTKATMLYGQAKPLIASGAAVLITDPPEPAAYQLPGDDDMVQMKVNGVPTPIPMKFSDAKVAVQSGAGQFVDTQLATEFAKDQEDDQAVAQSAAAAPNPVASSSGDQNSLDPGLTVQGDDGRWSHPAVPGKDYATKGAVTQALNRLGKNGAPVPATPPPTSAGTTPAAAPTTGIEAKLEQAKNLLRDMPEIQSDFKILLGLFDEVAGKRQITDFTEAELDKLITRLGEMKAESA